MTISPQNTPVGFIGTGVMGKSMAAHILDAGYRVAVFTRTKSRARDLLDRGASWADSPAAVAAQSRMIITIVGFPADVEQVYFGEDGLMAALQPESYVVDMTTSSPELAQRIAETAAQKNAYAVDAPVSGGDIGARDARLSIMCGGDKAAFDAVLPVLRIMGKAIVYQGPAGSGQHTKMANQIAIAAGMLGVCEAIAYARKAGLDPLTVLESIGGGAAGSWSLTNLAPRMIAGNFDPGFYVKHFIKDMRIAADSASRLHLDTAGLNLAKAMYEKLSDRGGDDLGTQALYTLYE
jgi:3-hydroxyisobutyrate dehydrogenase